MGILPLQILSKSFSYLSTRDKLNCLRVNRYFSHAAVTSLYSNLTLSQDSFINCLDTLSKGKLYLYGDFIVSLTIPSQESQGIDIGDLDTVSCQTQFSSILLL